MTKKRCLLLAFFSIVAVDISGQASASDFRLLYAFDDSSGNGGAFPAAGLVEFDGTLYGTTLVGGALHAGTVFAVNPKTDAERIVSSSFSFSGNDGANPMLLIKGNHMLYGVAGGGVLTGCTGCGVVFTVNPRTGAKRVLHAFTNGSGGAQPNDLKNVGGTLYGTTRYGGAYGFGVVFTMNPQTGAEKVLYPFKGGNDGASPGSLVKVGNILYGTTLVGGTTNQQCYESSCGTVFALDLKTHVQKMVYAFKGGRDGQQPSSLTSVGDTLYGTTDNGGTSSESGTVFAINPKTGTETFRYAFKGGRDGAVPAGGLTNVGGLLYGTTALGGSSNDGTVFVLNPQTGAETVIHDFEGASINPYAGLLSVGGTLYGTTEGSPSDNPENLGTVFAITP